MTAQAAQSYEAMSDLALAACVARNDARAIRLVPFAGADCESLTRRVLERLGHSGGTIGGEAP